MALGYPINLPPPSLPPLSPATSRTLGTRRAGALWSSMAVKPRLISLVPGESETKPTASRVFPSMFPVQSQVKTCCVTCDSLWIPTSERSPGLPSSISATSPDSAHLHLNDMGHHKNEIICSHQPYRPTYLSDFLQEYTPSCHLQSSPSWSPVSPHFTLNFHCSSTLERRLKVVHLKRSVCGTGDIIIWVAFHVILKGSSIWIPARVYGPHTVTNGQILPLCGMCYWCYITTASLFDVRTL